MQFNFSSEPYPSDPHSEGLDGLAVDPTNPNASDLITFQLDLTTETIRPTESLFDL
jgi:hypothetical protein